MPIINGRYYMNPQYGNALEAARAADAAREARSSRGLSAQQGAPSNESWLDQQIDKHSPPLPSRPPSLTPPKPPVAPSQDDVESYLGQLADEYRLPRTLVYAVADKESSLKPDVHPNSNAEERHGNKVVRSTDYGLMQINSRKIGESVKDPNGKPFTIGNDVTYDWKANARAGVAILNDAYDLAKMEQGPTATAEDHAQQVYSHYNGGRGARDRYLKKRGDGEPAHKNDREFLKEYEAWTAGRKK